MKKCGKCKEIKEDNCFYSDKRSKDGLYNSCKECHNKKTSKVYKQAMKDPVKADLMRKKVLENYHRNKLTSKVSRIRELNAINCKKYRDQNREKRYAVAATQKMERAPGHVLHHVMYHKEYWIYVVELSIKDHALVHRHLKYDKDNLCYRDLQGNILDTPEKHIVYISNILGKELLNQIKNGKH